VVIDATEFTFFISTDKINLKLLPRILIINKLVYHCHYAAGLKSALIFFIGVYGLLNLLNTTAYSSSLDKGIYPIHSDPYGKSYGEWLAKWWQWVTSLPTSGSQELGTPSDNCIVGKDDPNVWLLSSEGSGGSLQYECTIPIGKALFIPILAGECDYLSDPSLKTESQLRDCASSGIQGAALEAKLDGVELRNPEIYRAYSPLFEITIPQENDWGGPSGVTKAVADGYYVILEPLSVGRHTFEFSVSILGNPLLGIDSYATNVKYMLNVQ
jgi:hypothetical protein